MTVEVRERGWLETPDAGNIPKILEYPKDNGLPGSMGENHWVSQRLVGKVWPVSSVRDRRSGTRNSVPVLWGGWDDSNGDRGTCFRQAAVV